MNKSYLTLERRPDLGDQYVRFVIAVGESVLYDLDVFPRKFTWADRRTPHTQAVQVGVHLAGQPYPSLQQVKLMALSEAVTWIARLGLNYEALLGALREQGWEEPLLSPIATHAALETLTTWSQLTNSETLHAIAEETVANLGDVFYDPIPEIDGYDAATLRANVVSTIHAGLLRAYNALGMQATQVPGPVYPTVYVDTDTLACPACGSRDIQLEGTQAVPVIENWLDGCHQVNETGEGDWIEAPQVHCCECGLDWQLRSDTDDSTGKACDCPGGLSDHEMLEIHGVTRIEWTPEGNIAIMQDGTRRAWIDVYSAANIAAGRHPGNPHFHLVTPVASPAEAQPDPRPTAYVSAVMGFRVELDAPIEGDSDSDFEPDVDWTRIRTTVFNALRSCSLPFDWEIVEVEDVRVLNHDGPGDGDD